MNSMNAIANAMIASVSKASDMVAVRDLGNSQSPYQRLYQRGRERAWRHTTSTHPSPCTPTSFQVNGKSKPLSLKLVGLRSPSLELFGFGLGFGETGTGSFGIGSGR